MQGCEVFAMTIFFRALSLKIKQILKFTTMKTLYIVRHTKSSWDSWELTDAQRPITEKGKERTKRVIDYLLQHHETLDLVISSPAVRAYQTAELIVKGLGYDEDKLTKEALLYGYDVDRVFNLFFGLSDDIENLMVVGHNPNITYLANQFLEEQIDYMPTSAVVCVEFDVKKWSDIAIQKAKQKFYITPKMLKK